MIRFAHDDPRIDAVEALLIDFPKGISKERVQAMTKLSTWITREVLRAGREAGRLTCVYLGNSKTLWTTAAHGKKLTAEVRAAARVATLAKRKEYREATKDGQSRAKLYEQPDFDPYGVPDLSVRRVVTNSWAPVRVPPGPTSIFNWNPHA